MTTESDLPLAGIKIVDLSIALTGPYAAALLGDQGADVVKVERPGFGDIGRYVGVSVNGLSALAQMCNRGKRSIALDVHQPAGREILLQLARDADVIVQNFRPGVVERLGIGYDDVRAVNERVVYASLSGFGPSGPYASKGAYDTVIQAYGGFAANQADAQTGEPHFLNQTAADKVTALVRGPGDHRRAVRPRTDGSRAHTCNSRCSTPSCRSCGPTRPATRCCRTPTGRSRRASSGTSSRSTSATGGASARRPPMPTSRACAGRSASTATTTRASRRSGNASSTAT